jgi:hypothetical protein
MKNNVQKKERQMEEGSRTKVKQRKNEKLLTTCWPATES